MPDPGAILLVRFGQFEEVEGLLSAVACCERRWVNFEIEVQSVQPLRAPSGPS
jgi:hypothetical protein